MSEAFPLCWLEGEEAGGDPRQERGQRAKVLAETTAAEQAARTQPPGRLWQVARVFRHGLD
jgi:hypothetical protein